ncbi:MAG: carboxylesterase family protein [Treponemataceae bacterium]|nr:carboxylesterase family protein [Treponemataceae bacterium]
MIKTTKISQGYVRGIAAADPRIISYKGIPYAAPPTGDLRWQPPQPHPGWDGVRDCYTFSPIPPQSKPQPGITNIYDLEWNVDKTIPMDEDCLTLNIWTPAQTSEERLPVYFWIYGGGLQWGNSAEMEFDGERIARRGIVVVTINYRLNVFGFFAADGVERNIGNRDQQFALKWVYENIAAFGGNPDHIVIGGQSAGGGSVISQLNYPENKKYIKGAVIESGYFINPYKDYFNFSEADAAAQSAEFLEHLGVKTIEEAKKLSWEQVRDGNDSFHKMWYGLYGNDFSRVKMEQAVKEKTFIDVPLLHGWTDIEFCEKTPGDTPEEFKAKAEEIFGNKAEEFMSLTKDGYFSPVEVGNIFMNHLLKENGYKSPDWLYEFSAFMPGGDNPGAFHSSDLWFFFETLAKCWRPFKGQDYDLARCMCNYLCNFIKNLDPNGNDSDGSALPQWNAYDKDAPDVMIFKTKPEVETRSEKGMMEFYQNFFHKKMCE